MKDGMVMELCASEKKIDREAQDALAEEIVPAEIPQRKGDPVVVDTNEKPGRVKLDRIPMLRPAFKKDGSVTAANASSINDGAGEDQGGSRPASSGESVVGGDGIRKSPSEAMIAGSPGAGSFPGGGISTNGGCVSIAHTQPLSAQMRFSGRSGARPRHWTARSTRDCPRARDCLGCG